MVEPNSDTIDQSTSIEGIYNEAVANLPFALSSAKAEYHEARSSSCASLLDAVETTYCPVKAICGCTQKKTGGEFLALLEEFYSHSTAAAQSIGECGSPDGSANFEIRVHEMEVPVCLYP